MRIPRAALGALLWILGSLLGLVGVLLCVTVVLLPVGIPLVMLARRMFTRSVALMLPRAVSHPVDELSKKSAKKARKARDATTDKARQVTGRKRRRLPGFG